MKNRLQNLLQDRKTLYLVLGLVLVSVFTLSVAYAAMESVLEIHGNSEVVASSWDMHLENVKVKSGSVSANVPQISGTSSVGFDVDLNIPGDFYEFTVDVVNDGSIDAMIDSVVKTPELTSEQAKYIKYEITYENGESISTKQTLKKGTSTPIKVRVEYRKDLVASDLPSSVTELSLKLTLIYVQSDGSGSNIPNNAAESSLVNVVSGDGTQVGNEVCIKEECFYVISSTDTTVTMLSKYNLHVGNIIDENYNATPLTNPKGIQDKTAIGMMSENGVDIFPFIGTIAYSDLSGELSTYYSGSNAEMYVENYIIELEKLGVSIIEGRIINYNELEKLGCNAGENSCMKAPSWVYSTSYWIDYVSEVTGEVGFVLTDSLMLFSFPNSDSTFGVRPVITISKDYF